MHAAHSSLLSIMLLLLRVSVLHVTFYVQFTSILTCYVTDVQLSRFY